MRIWKSGRRSEDGDQPLKTRIPDIGRSTAASYGISVYLNSQPDGETGSLSHAPGKIAEYQPQLLLTALWLGAEDSLN
jgi:hypothetical protein